MDKDHGSASGSLAGAFFSWMDEWAKGVGLMPDALIAVAVSGGADSMALSHLMRRWTKGAGYRLLVLTVDHALRKEAADEARAVSEFIKELDKGCGQALHKTLIWEHEKKLSSRVQEEARFARYELMGQEMRECGAKYLFTAHHQGDQAETFLFRLAKGSGLDGLAGMAEQQEFEGGLVLCRPILGQPKSALVGYCAEQGISFMHDPSNDQEKFSRVRLRKSMDVLEAEGLTEKRLAQTAKRMSRARKALEQITAQSYAEITLKKEPDSIVFNFNVLKKLPEEIIYRIIVMAIDDVGDCGQYGVRSEKVESLLSDLLKPFPFRKRTLGKMIFERDDKNGFLIVSREVGQ